jgi:hypothetical protein
MGTIPLEDLFRRVDFLKNPSCCIELSPDFYSLAPQALLSAREIVESADRKTLVS